MFSFKRWSYIAVLAVIAAACTESSPLPTDPGPVATPAVRLPTRTVGMTAGTRFLACTQRRELSITRVIGPSGGILNLRGSRVIIPRGAVPHPETFVLTLPAGSLMEVDLRAVGYAHYVFAKPITIRLSYARCGVAQEHAPLRAVYVDETSKTVLGDMGGTDDRHGKTVTFQTDHLSGYVLSY